MCVAGDPRAWLRSGRRSGGDQLLYLATYSSIYISSSIALDCGLTAEDVFPTIKKDAVDSLP